MLETKIHNTKILCILVIKCWQTSVHDLVFLSQVGEPFNDLEKETLFQSCKSKRCNAPGNKAVAW